MLAFNKLDKTGDGLVTLDDLKDSYDVSFHPEFKQGKKSKQAILEEFMGQWDTIKKDGIVSPDEWIEYYKDVSASIDDDDYFELMIRNAWHIAGGKGQYENTTIKRELVRDKDGNEKVVMSKGHENFTYEKNAKRFWGADI
jgi:calcyphosin